MFKQKFWLAVFIIYLLFSTALLSIGVWPQWVIFANLALQLAAIFLFDLEFALYSMVLSLPFYLAVPNPKFDTLSQWRFTFAALFVVFWWKQHKSNQAIKLFEWDANLIWLACALALSILFEPFKTQGVKRLIFFVNVYFVYIVALNVVKTRQQILGLIKAIFASLAMIVAIGYIQFASTFATSTYYFWQYWAELISKVYYGKTLADALTYSNSWFTFYKNSQPSLRMFSILPDSHAFAVLAMFSIPYAAALIRFAQKKWQRILLWIYLVLAVLAIVFSGTRGVWAGILAPLIVLVYLFSKHWGRKLIRPMFVPIIIFFVLLAASPLIQKGVNVVRSGSNAGDFISRAASIYDLSDSSNAGRITIWKSTLKFALAHPLVGSGLGNFVITLGPNSKNPDVSYSQIASQKVKAFNLPKQYITAHNLYLDFLAETGIIGLAALLYYLFALAKTFWNFFKTHYLFSEDQLVFFATNTALYLVWLFAYMLVDGTLLNDRVLIYFFLNLAISASIIRVFKSENKVNA